MPLRFLYPPPMKRRPELILLDLDGTLVDSFPGITEALNEALAAFAAPPVDLEWVRQHVGRGARVLVTDAAAAADGSVDIDRLLEVFRSTYGALHLEKTPPIPGVDTTLRELAADSPLALVSNKPVDWSRDLIRHLGWAPLFAAVEGPETAGARKPDPAMVHRVLETLGVPPDRSLLVGDMEVDVATARAAGVPLVGVTSGARSEMELREAGAGVVLPDLTALPAWLRGGGRWNPLQ